MERLFIGIFPAPEIQSKISDYVERLDESLKAVRWSQPANLHYTLRFLGSVPPSDQLKVTHALVRVAGMTAPFHFEIRELGAFPKWENAKVIWLGGGAGSNTLVALSRALDRALSEEGLGPRDKPFTPHLTLGRLGDPRGTKFSPETVEAFPKAPVWRLPVTELCLVRSILGQGSPRYEILRRAPLAGEVPKT